MSCTTMINRSVLWSRRQSTFSNRSEFRMDVLFHRCMPCNCNHHVYTDIHGYDIRGCCATTQHRSKHTFACLERRRKRFSRIDLMLFIPRRSYHSGHYNYQSNPKSSVRMFDSCSPEEILLASVHAMMNPQ